MKKPGRPKNSKNKHRHIYMYPLDGSRICSCGKKDVMGTFSKQPFVQKFFKLPMKVPRLVRS